MALTQTLPLRARSNGRIEDPAIPASTSADGTSAASASTDAASPSKCASRPEPLLPAEQMGVLDRERSDQLPHAVGLSVSRRLIADLATFGQNPENYISKGFVRKVGLFRAQRPSSFDQIWENAMHIRRACENDALGRRLAPAADVFAVATAHGTTSSTITRERDVESDVDLNGVFGGPTVGAPGPYDWISWPSQDCQRTDSPFGSGWRSPSVATVVRPSSGWCA